MKDDSQLRARKRTPAYVRGIEFANLGLERTSVDVHGCMTRGLQNRLRGAVEASRVSSILIHPRSFGWNDQDGQPHGSERVREAP